MLECSSNYSDTTVSLWSYSKHGATSPNNDTANISKFLLLI